MPVSVALQTASMGVHATRNPQVVGPSSGSRSGPLASHVPIIPLDKNQQPPYVPSSEPHTSRLVPPTEVDRGSGNPLSTPLISPPKIMVSTTTSRKPAPHIPSLPSLRYDPQKEPKFRTQLSIVSKEMNTNATASSGNLSNTTFSDPLMTSSPTPVTSVPRDQYRPQTQSTSSSNLDPPPTVGHGVKRRLGMGRTATGYANKKFKPHT